jgi:hypothetical protein
MNYRSRLRALPRRYTMRVMGVAWCGVAAMALFVVGLMACQWVAGIEDIELTSGSSAAGTSSGAGTGGKTGASTSASSTTASTSASGAGGAGPTTVKYGAVVADCVDINNPNPDDCKIGADQMRITTMEFMTGKHYSAFLRFNLDGALAGRTVTAVTLYLSTTTDPNAGSDKSGSIWQVSAFDRPDLFGKVPSNVGNKPVADDLGTVNDLTTYKWSLPATLVAANTPLYLGLAPNSKDSARYWNTIGAKPPELVIDLQ